LLCFTGRIGDGMLLRGIRAGCKSVFSLAPPRQYQQQNNKSSSLTNRTLETQSSVVNMKFSIRTLPFITVLAALSQSAAASPTPNGNLVAQDVCPPGYPSFCRSTGSPCAASNGVHEFCSCDRTNIVSDLTNNHQASM
jgi:hypothetical protein